MTSPNLQGTALPICLYVCTLETGNTKESGKVWTLATSFSVSLRISVSEYLTRASQPSL